MIRFEPCMGRVAYTHRHHAGSWGHACPYSPRSGMTVVPVQPCAACVNAGETAEILSKSQCGGFEFLEYKGQKIVVCTNCWKYGRPGQDHQCSGQGNPPLDFLPALKDGEEVKQVGPPFQSSKSAIASLLNRNLAGIKQAIPLCSLGRPSSLPTLRKSSGASGNSQRMAWQTTLAPPPGGAKGSTRSSIAWATMVKVM